MCRCCCYETEGCYAHHEHGREHEPMGFPWPVMGVEEEIKMLEEYREALTKRLGEVNKRLEAMKR